MAIENLQFGKSARTCANGAISAGCVSAGRLTVAGVDIDPRCISNPDGSTSVCALDSGIEFTNQGVVSGKVTNGGVLVWTAGNVDPDDVVVNPGKVAVFDGDIDVTGVIDPTGVVFTEQSLPPVSPGAGEGTLYVRSGAVGPYANAPTFLDSGGTEHTLGNVIGPAVAQNNAIVRFGATGETVIEDSSLTLGDDGEISRLLGNIAITPNAGLGTVRINGNVDVTGETTQVRSENVLISDNCIYLNSGNTDSSTPRAGCIFTNFLATPNTTNVGGSGFTAGGGSGPTVETDGAGPTFVAGDILQISDPTGGTNLSNLGLFEVQSHVGTVIEIRGVGGTPTTFDYFDKDFVDDSATGAIITQVTVSVISSGSDGLWEVNTPMSTTVGQVFNKLVTTVVSGSPYQQIGTLITPIVTPADAILAGDSNTIAPNPTYSDNAITAGNSNSITGYVSRNAITSGNANGISATDPTNCEALNNAIAGGSMNAIRSLVANESCLNNFVGGGRSNVIDGPHSQCGIVAGSDCSFAGSACEDSAIGSSSNSTQSGTARCFLGSTNVCSITDAVDSAIIASQNSTIVGNSAAAGNCIVGGGNHTIRNLAPTTVNYNVVLGGTGSVVTDVSSSIVAGTNVDCNHNGCFMFSDSNTSVGVQRLASTADHQFAARCTGGAVFYSNNLNTTGVTLAPGANSWGMVSDRTKKENLTKVDTMAAMANLAKIPIYSYNFIGNPKEQVCIGPMAQDWHQHFGCADVEVEQINSDGEKVRASQPAKDPLVIELMDMCGVAMACLQNLNERLRKLERATAR